MMPTIHLLLHSMYAAAASMETITSILLNYI